MMDGRDEGRSDFVFGCFFKEGRQAGRKEGRDERMTLHDGAGFNDVGAANFLNVEPGPDASFDGI